jgi:hypothetical protein
VVVVSPTGVVDAMPHARPRQQDIRASAALVHLSMGMAVRFSRVTANAPARPRNGVVAQGVD